MKLVVFPCMWLVVCGQTWVKENDNNEYLIGRNIVNSFEEARSECNKYKADLAIIITTSQNTASFDFLKRTIGTPPGRPYSYYIGATFNTNTNRFHWVNGNEMQHGQWDAKEPIAVDNKYCVIMGSLTELDPTYKWRTANCSVDSRYICQRNPSKSNSSVTTTTTTTRSSPTSTIPPATTTSIPQPQSTSSDPKTLNGVMSTVSSGKSTKPVSSNSHQASASNTSTSDPESASMLPAIIGAACGIIVICIAILVLVSIKRKRNRERLPKTPLRNGNNRNDEEAHADKAEEIYATPKTRKAVQGGSEPPEDDTYIVPDPPQTESEVIYTDMKKDYDHLHYPDPPEEAYDQLPRASMQRYGNADASEDHSETYDQLQRPTPRADVVNESSDFDVYDRPSNVRGAAPALSYGEDDETYAIVTKSKKK